MRGNKNSWFHMSVYDKNAGSGIFFGPALQSEKSSYMYPNEKIKNGETVIWVPAEKKTVSLKSYERAHQENVYEDLCKISKLGIPLGCDFGGILNLTK